MKSVPKLTSQIVINHIRYIPQPLKEKYGYNPWGTSRRNSSYERYFETIRETYFKFLMHLERKQKLQEFYKDYEEYTKNN